MTTSHKRKPALGPDAGQDAHPDDAGRRLDAWMTAALGPEAGGRRETDGGPGDPSAVIPSPEPAYATLLEATSASERRAIDTAAKTASALGSVASWIERAQQQLTETTSAASRAQEEAAALLNQAVGSLGKRLNDVERKVEVKPDQDGTLEAIQRLERRLASQPAAEPAQASKTEFEQALKGFEARLADIGEKIAGAPRPIGRRGLTETAEIDGAVAEIRSRQAAIEKGADRAMLPALGTLARSQTAILTSLKADVTRIAARMEEAAPERAAEAVREQVETIRGSMGEVATRDDLGRLERSIGSLTHDIAELRKASHGAASAESLEGLQREVSRLAAANAGPGVAARDVELLSRKLDIVAASGVDPGLIGSLARQVDEVRELLSKSAAPQALSLVNRHLADLQREIGEVGGRQVAPGEFTALKETVDEMRTALVAFGRQAAERRPEPAPDAIRAIEPMLSALVDRLERVEQRAADPEALHGLERQLETLASRIGQSPLGADPGIAGLERSVNTLLSEAASWRDGAVEAAERAARAAVGELAGTLPQAPDVERHLVELREHFDAAEERTFQSLETVHAALEAAMSRITSLESEAPRPAPAAPLAEPVPAAEAPRREPAPPAAPPPAAPPAAAPPAAAPPKGTVPKRPVPNGPVAPPVIEPPHEADIPLPPAPEDEVLLEPGAARPGAPAAGRPAPVPTVEPGDIKSSFIAAARRAAQAAAAEGSPRAGAPRTRASEGATLAGLSRSELAKRLRRMIGDRRRTLLLGAAALVLALGTVQIARTLAIGTSQAPSATRTAEIAGPPARPATPPATSPPPLATLPASPASPPAPGTPAAAPDPVTTQSVAPRAVAGPQPEATPPGLPVLAAAPPSTAARLPGEKPSERVADIPTRMAALPGGALATPVTAPVLQPGLKGAALAGDPVALYELAARTFDGRGVPRDQKAAAALFEKAAEKGLAPAQYRIGNMYERGIGVDRNAELARSWYRKAAEAGNVRAMHNLAVLLAEGGAGKADYPGALGWFTRAAERGIRDSQFNLAVLYARGLGTPQDLSKAYLWLAVVAGQGDEDAGKKRDEVGGRLSAADLARAKAEVARWRPLPATAAANEVQVPAAGWPEPPVKRASRVTNL